jgi:hypothetical protein
VFVSLCVCSSSVTDSTVDEWCSSMSCRESLNSLGTLVRPAPRASNCVHQRPARSEICYIVVMSVLLLSKLAFTNFIYFQISTRMDWAHINKTYSPHLYQVGLNECHKCLYCRCVTARSLNWLPIVNFMGVVKLLWTGTVSDRADKLSVFLICWTTLYPNGF